MKKTPLLPRTGRPLIILSLLIALGATLAARADDRDKPNPPPNRFSKQHQFVFFAVLEGCYRDGLVAEDLDHIVPKGKNGDRVMTTNLVYTCPLCHPAYEAFRLYSAGRPFYGQKGTAYSTFGPGLNKAVREQLAKPGLSCRNAIQGLIKKWVDERIAKLCLSDGDTKELREILAQMRKDGEKALNRFQNSEHGDYYQKIYKGWKSCPVCSGASPMRGEKE